VVGISAATTVDRSDGSQREETCFVDCRAFGRTAENINKFFSKGKPIFIEGRLTFDSWTAQDGSKRSKHRVTVENFQFLSGGGPGGPDQSVPDAAAEAEPREQPSNDDIPF
jgi:single-strand DNA-binding protein